MNWKLTSPGNCSPSTVCSEPFPVGVLQWKWNCAVLNVPFSPPPLTLNLPLGPTLTVKAWPLFVALTTISLGIVSNDVKVKLPSAFSYTQSLVTMLIGDCLDPLQALKLSPHVAGPEKTVRLYEHFFFPSCFFSCLYRLIALSVCQLLLIFLDSGCVPSVFLYTLIYRSAHPSVYPSEHLFVWLADCLSVSVCMTVWLSVYHFVLRKGYRPKRQLQFAFSVPFSSVCLSFLISLLLLSRRLYVISAVSLCIMETWKSPLPFLPL